MGAAASRILINFLCLPVPELRRSWIGLSRRGEPSATNASRTAVQAPRRIALTAAPVLTVALLGLLCVIGLAVRLVIFFRELGVPAADESLEER